MPETEVRDLLARFSQRDRAALGALADLLDKAGRKDAALSLRRLPPDLRRCDPLLLRLTAALVASVICPTTEPTA